MTRRRLIAKVGMVDIGRAQSEPLLERLGPRWLAGGGEMGALLRATDWSATPLGPIATWPPSLRGAIALCLGSAFPFSIVWGPRHLHIYNDGYARLRGSEPAVVGLNFKEFWRSAWSVFAGPFERALAGESCALENQQTFLERNGREEETYLTFSLCPIRDDAGGVCGVFHSVTEATGQVVGERRARVLRELMAATVTARSVDEVLELSAQTLTKALLDVPFAHFYTVDARLSEVRLITGMPHGVRGLDPPMRMALDARSSASASIIAEVVRSNRTRTIQDTGAYFGSLASGSSPASPGAALVLPITPPGYESPLAVLVAGTGPRLPLDEDYRAFYQLLSEGIASSAANALAHEEQRRQLEQLRELDRAKTGFFSDVSHEFRTPITLMVGPLEEELAEVSAPLPAARRERLEVAHRNALRLLKLVNVLLDLSRVESGRILANYRPTDLSAMTSELVSMFRSAIERAGLALMLDVEPLPEPIYVDHEMWEKIVLNLMSNAFKHTFQGSISARLRYLPETVELEIADSGIGIAADDLPHLFERFQRVIGARSRTREGSGIGLALVRELSRLHGGEVRVASELGRGAAFTVSLRRGKAHLPPENVGFQEATGSPGGADVAAYVQEALQWSAAVASPDSRGGGLARSGIEGPVQAPAKKPVILVADDNADMREYVGRLLGGAYQVVAVQDGAAALEAVVQKRPDLVLADVMMPGLDGFGLLRALRANESTQRVPVILLSARAGEDAAVEGLEAGADDYLVKPFSARELLARVRTNLELARVHRKWAEHLEQANQDLEAFSYSVSHDLRTPLRAIDGFSKAILARKAEQLDDEGKAYLNRVRAAAGRMSELIDELLSLARVSRVPVHPQSVDLTQIVRSVASSLDEQNTACHVDFECEEQLVAHVDARLVRIVFENLLGNSWKFTARRSDPQVRVGRVAGRDVRTYFVRDNGVGFDQAYAHRLFQPFQRLHADSDFRGSGIGLAIVHRIVTRHGGEIWAESQESQGATFYFTLSEKT